MNDPGVNAADPERPVRLGVVLSSGGVRGIYAHTGFLLALKQLSVNISALAGCSAGAVVGGIAASGADLRQWEQSLTQATARTFWRPNWIRFLWALAFRQGRGCTGVSSTEAAQNFCRKHLRAETFENCLYPFHALAIDIATGEKRIFNKGELAPSMIASAAIPLLFQPVEIDGDLCCDGAIIDLAPTDAICCQYKLDVLIVHHVAHRQETRDDLRRSLGEPWSLIEILNRLLYQRRPWYLSDEPLVFRRCPCGCGAVVVILEPQLPELPWPGTRIGPKVLASAREQTGQLLGPYVQSLKWDRTGIEQNIV